MPADDGFFTHAQAMSFRPAVSMFPACERCQLYKNCVSPRMKPTGQGKRRILICSDYPGVEEDREGRQFVGQSGQYLRGVLYDYGITPNDDCIFTNATICYSPDIKKHKTALKDCFPNLLNTIKQYQPTTIILAGMEAVSSLMPYAWENEGGVGNAIGKWVGWRIPCQSLNAWLCPTWNPAYIIRDRDNPKPNRALELHFREHIKQAVGLRGCPWPDAPPDYPSRAEVVFDPEEAVRRINKYNNLIAFDIETTTLKPQGPHAEIVCCSICDGKETIAFPWCKTTREAMKELLENPEIGKIGANNSFENSWLAEEGIEIRGWCWDDVENAHLSDTRGGITGVDFQSWVWTGVRAYWRHMEPYLKSRDGGGNSPNRIRELDPYDVMKYCALDSLVEWEIAKRQVDFLSLDIGMGE